MVTDTAVEEFSVPLTSLFKLVLHIYYYLSIYSGTLKLPTYGELLLIYQISMHSRVMLLQSIKIIDQFKKYSDRNFLSLNSY